MSILNSDILIYLKRKNIKRFGLFFLLAFVFLIFSKLSSSYNQTIKLKIKLTNLSDEIILSNDSLNVLDAVVEAKGFSLIPFIFKPYKEIDIDALKDVSLKSNRFLFDVNKNRYLIEQDLGESYKILSIKPDTLWLSYSELASKMVPVKFVKNISFEDGFDIVDDFTFNLDSIKVVGPIDSIKAIDNIQTQLLEITDVKNNIEESLMLNVSDYNNIEVFPKTIKVSGVVKRFTEGMVVVPFEIVNKDPQININYFPKTVDVSYYVDLERFNSVKSSDFRVICDYVEIEKSQSYLVPKLVAKPDFIKRASVKQKRIDLIFL